MLQILPTALPREKAGNTFEHLLNGILRIRYSLHQAKEITKKGHNNIMNSTKLQYKMETIFMNSESNSDPHRLLLSLSDNINLNRSDKCCFIKS